MPEDRPLPDGVGNAPPRWVRALIARGVDIVRHVLPTRTTARRYSVLVDRSHEHAQREFTRDFGTEFTHCTCHLMPEP